MKILPYMRLKAIILPAALVFVISCAQNEMETDPELVNPKAELSTAAVWRQANLTNFESYPDPDSDECILYNGCQWAGQFAFVSGVMPESWVASHNIIALHSRDAYQYKLKTLRIRQGDRQIDAVVYDFCSDTDCDGCCTTNADENGIGFLIDMEKYTMQRFGSGSGIVEWTCLDCD
ncbi:hypothetical protein [Sinomicrobium pectinilyticum]|nr:hypothetical protein [Sinomicrobium pectinilyticum]